ncbi:MAG: hypothetical protein J3Q66DRAFT_353713, partial [Benniella sp.]
MNRLVYWSSVNGTLPIHPACPALLSFVVVLSPCPFVLHVLCCPPVVMAIVSCAT